MLICQPHYNIKLWDTDTGCLFHLNQSCSTISYFVNEQRVWEDCQLLGLKV